jgi:hypothetical protein
MWLLTCLRQACGQHKDGTKSVVAELAFWESLDGFYSICVNWLNTEAYSVGEESISICMLLVKFGDTASAWHVHSRLSTKLYLLFLQRFKKGI